MKISIFAAGSTGDVQPCVALGVGLKKAGYEVQMVVPTNFGDLILKHNLEFFPLRGDVQQVMASDYGKNFMEKGGSNPFNSIRVMRRLIAPIVKNMVSDAYDACKGSDALICLGVFSPFGQSISESLGIPIINLEPTPLVPTRYFPAPSWPIQKNLGGLHNYLSGILMLQAIWMWYSPFVKEFRQNLGLPAKNANYFYRKLKNNNLLGAYSLNLIPHLVDWPKSVRITGCFRLDDSVEWEPSTDLVTFLEAGDPPVYIGFGSMAGKNSEEMTDIVFEALKICGQRGVVLTGWGGIQRKKSPENVFILESAPHQWLFPRMAALVHHGGAGTTSEGLRAGKPTIVIPFLFDQFFWGERIYSHGFGPAPIPRKNLTADRLAEAIQKAVNDPLIRKKAAECGVSMRSNDGVQNAVSIIQQILSGHP